MQGKKCELLLSLGAAITKRRKQKGLTQAQLAGLLGISHASLSQMENGLIAPRLSRLQDIADALSCSVADLFRPAPSNTTQKAAVIADMLQALPEYFQDISLSMVESAVKNLRDSDKKNNMTPKK